ncbi:MAG: phospholipid/cholesterol/gamma-HCH transport system substrate-binding protein [Pseudonocardiales bacterium]|jgi:phospholipid/cholesterol/gamma-HCH transport system substrate-binding protein|nr:phospholipid/cholesterol/gamma-HCH transport system substrate-binding protein [Pseudonocardiales bacterium]
MTLSRPRHPIAIGIAGLVILALLATAAYNADRLPFIGGGTIYTAQFSDAAGLRAGDPVYIAGVEVGRVTAIELAGDRVRASLRVRNAWLGDQTNAAIEIKSLLGAKSVSLDPRGQRALDPRTPIPLSRTASPYDVVEALGGLSGTLQQIDTAQLEQSLQTLADTFRATPADVRGTLNGLSRLSETIAGRDQQIHHLLAGTEALTGVLAGRNAEFERLLADGNLLLAEVRRRREAISALLTDVQALSLQLRGLVADNTAQLRPALQQLDRVAAVLQRNQLNLDRGLALEPVFIRLFTNTLGNGRWFDNYICGLLPPPTALGPLTINERGC